MIEKHQQLGKAQSCSVDEMQRLEDKVELLSADLRSAKHQAKSAASKGKQLSDQCALLQQKLEEQVWRAVQMDGFSRLGIDLMLAHSLNCS